MIWNESLYNAYGTTAQLIHPAKSIMRITKALQTLKRGTVTKSVTNLLPTNLHLEQSCKRAD